MGELCVLSGGVHDRLTEREVKAMMRGRPGASGTSAKGDTYK